MSIQPSELPEDAEQAVTACERLHSFTMGTLIPGTPLPYTPAEAPRVHPEHQRAAVQFETLMRASSTFQALTVLGRHAYGLQMEMLARSLVEDMVAAFWIAIHRDPLWIVDRLDEHRQHREMLRHRARHGDATLPPSVDVELATRLDGQFGSFGERYWFGKSLYHALEDIRRNWPLQGRRPDRLEALNRLFRIEHPELNAILHHGAPALDGITTDFHPPAVPVQARPQDSRKVVPASEVVLFAGGARATWVGPTIGRVVAAAAVAFDVHGLHLQHYSDEYAHGFRVHEELTAILATAMYRRDA